MIDLSESIRSSVAGTHAVVLLRLCTIIFEHLDGHANFSPTR